MESENRGIGGCNCFKSTTVPVVSKTDFRNLRPKKEDATITKLVTAVKKINLLNKFEMSKETIIIAWCTP